MTDTYSVSYITHTMRGAPQIRGNAPGGLIDVLDCVLVTGWGLAAPTSVTVASGTATATFSGPTSWEVGAVIEISGGTPSGLAGKSRVASVVGNTLTFATPAADGTYTGSIGIKYAGAGWEKVFSGTNKAVYRSTDVTGSRFYLRVDASSGQFARVRGYETMSDIDTGTGLFPIDAQLSGGGYWHTSVASNATAIPYLLAADSKMLLQAICLGVSNGATQMITAVYGFGDGIALNPAGDAFAAVLSCKTIASYIYLSYGGLSGASGNSSPDYGAVFFARGWQGLGDAVYARPVPEGGSATALSGADSALGVAPGRVDGAIRMARMMLKDQETNDLRCVVPGCHFVPQSLNNGLFPTPFALSDGAGTLAGRKLAAVPVGNDTSNRSGTAFVDVTGPWR
jgi:hypothetical protein